MKWFMPTLLIGLGIAGFLLITKPIYEEALVLKEQADKYNEALANARILQQERDRLTSKFNSFNKSDIERLEKIVPDSVDNIKLILEIQKVAEEKGIFVSNVEFEPEQFTQQENQNQQSNIRRPGANENLDYDVFNLEFSIGGRYADFVDFMALLEKSLRVVDIKSISFTPGSSVGRDNMFTDDYRYTFRINTFRLKDI